MRFLQSTAMIATLVGMVALSCASAEAMPLSAAAHQSLLAQQNGDFLPFIVPAQYRRGDTPGPRRSPPRRHYDGGDDTGAAVAAGIFGLILGGMIAAEAQRQQAMAYCARRFRSYDPQSMTYLGNDGYRHPCP